MTQFDKCGLRMSLKKASGSTLMVMWSCPTWWWGLGVEGGRRMAIHVADGLGATLHLQKDSEVAVRKPF